MDKLNRKIGEHPGGAWGFALLIVVAIIYVGQSVFPSLAIAVEVVGVFLFWAANPYICYLAARKQNRNEIAWILFGMFFMPLPVMILSHYAHYKRLAEKKSAQENLG